MYVIRTQHETYRLKMARRTDSFSPPHPQAKFLVAEVRGTDAFVTWMVPEPGDREYENPGAALAPGSRPVAPRG